MNKWNESVESGELEGAKVTYGRLAGEAAATPQLQLNHALSEYLESI